jgi:hypothetical protein
MVRTCANEECKKDYEPKVHNSKYCSNDCCLAVAKQKTAAAKNERRSLKKRQCACGTYLSSYNPDNMCHACKAREENEVLKLLELLEDGGA